MMDYLNLKMLYSGLVIAFQPDNILYCFIGTLIGTLIGVLPGLGPAATIAILMPITFSLPAVSAIIMFAGIYYGAMYGGSNSSILVNIPGESASVITCIDGYQMARQGRAGPALGISAFGSFIAGVLGVLIITFLAPPLATMALSFGAPEYFSLMVFGLTLVTFLGSESMLKALMMAVVGIILGCVGQDPIYGQPRLIFGIESLWDGIGFVPIIMGLFGISEILINVEKTFEEQSIYKGKIGGLLPDRDDWRKSAMPIARGTIIGFFIGAIPGGGPTIASLLSYGVEKRLSKNPETFGNGAIEGVAGPETANNAATIGGMVPLLTLGIPCNVVMALFLGALIIHGTTPGPLLIADHPDLFWGVLVSMLVGNLLLLMLNLPLIGIWVKLLTVPYKFLFPVIIIFCLIGVYTVNTRVSDINVMLIFSVLGYLMKKYDYPGAPLILAFVLGPMLEDSLRQSLIMFHGNFGVFFQRPISFTCILLAIIFLLLPFISGLLKQVRKKGKS